jgi:hypothetical protein
LSSAAAVRDRATPRRSGANTVPYFQSLSPGFASSLNPKPWRPRFAPNPAQVRTLLGIPDESSDFDVVFEIKVPQSGEMRAPQSESPGHHAGRAVARACSLQAGRCRTRRGRVQAPGWPSPRAPRRDTRWVTRQAAGQHIGCPPKRATPAAHPPITTLPPARPQASACSFPGLAPSTPPPTARPSPPRAAPRANCGSRRRRRAHRLCRRLLRR